MKINLDYQQPPAAPNEHQLTNRELTWDYINHAVLKKYPHVPPGKIMSLFASIDRKFDVATKENLDDVDLTSEEAAFLRTCVADCAYPITLAKFVVIFINELFKNAPQKEIQSGGTIESATANPTP